MVKRKAVSTLKSSNRLAASPKQGMGIARKRCAFLPVGGNGRVRALSQYGEAQFPPAGRYLLKQDGFMKRQRGRGRKPGGGGGGGGGGNHGNRPLESNGPEVKIRGTAAQIYEKYSQYARDAQSSGDRVKTENYLQHAEHYYRIMAATMPREQRMQQSETTGFSSGGGFDREAEEQTVEAGGGSEHSEADGQTVVSAADTSVAEAGETDTDDADGRGDEDTEASASGDRPDGNIRSRRRRQRRRHMDGDGQERPQAGDTEARSALDALAQKQGALAGG
jgi:hypothetical protein